MAINRSDYPHKVDVGLWANDLFIVFLYRFNYERSEYSGLIDFSSKRNWSKKDKISQAKSEMSSIKNKKKDIRTSENKTGGSNAPWRT